MSDRERWRNVRRAPSYRVSSYGQVKSPGGVLQQFRDKDGYWCVTIRGERVPVHLLVLEAFRCLRPYGMEGCHGRNGQDDNRESQLRWDTHRENIKDKRRERKTGSEVGTYPQWPETPETCEVQ